MGKVLDRLRERGWFALHDVQLGRGNIDHVLVGPAGVFTIETKSHCGRLRASAIEVRMLKQAYALAKLIERITGLRADPLLVFSNAYLIPAVTRRDGVLILPARMLAGHLQRRARTITPERVNDLYQRLAAVLLDKQTTPPSASPDDSLPSRSEIDPEHLIQFQLALAERIGCGRPCSWLTSSPTPYESSNAASDASLARYGSRIIWTIQPSVARSKAGECVAKESRRSPAPGRPKRSCRRSSPTIAIRASSAAKLQTSRHRDVAIALARPGRPDDVSDRRSSGADEYSIRGAGTSQNLAFSLVGVWIFHHRR